MAHNTNFTASDAAICGVAFMVAIFVTAAYGILTDIFHNHWMWFLIDVSTCGNRGDSTGNNAFNANNGDGAFNPANQLKLRATEPDGARVFESRATVVMGDEPHKYVYVQRSKADGSQEFYVTDTTSKFAINMVNCKPE